MQTISFSPLRTQFNFNLSKMIRSIVSQLSRQMATAVSKSSTAMGIKSGMSIQFRCGVMTPLVRQINFRFSTVNQQSQNKAATFSDFVTDPIILNKLNQNGLVSMFPVQSQTFPLLLNGQDILASDRTGSGKTLAYTLPILEKIYRTGESPIKIKKPKFLIMSPTRQLALQVTNQIKKFAPDYRVVTLYGGASISEQIRTMERGVAIIVATPGRLIDLIDKGAVDLRELEAVCLDEADTMLEKGFKLDVERIMEEVSEAAGETQNLMFSATIPPWVAKIASHYLKNMKKINLINESEERTSQTVEHYALLVKEKERHETVLQLIQRFNPENRTIVFTQTKMEANDFIKYFDRDQIVILHGDIPQNVREINLNKFRKGEQKILIATDVAARGLDIPEVELIIQLSPPENPEPYIHRSGRTGRAGKEGVNITFFNESNIEDLMEIERAAKIKIKIINNNFNITLWKKEADHLIEEIANNQEETNDPFYQLFVDEIIKRTTPEKALLYFLKHKLGKVPQMTSAITNRKGYITYIAQRTQSNSQIKIQDTFKDMEILNLTENETQSKFDILWNDYYHFEQMIDKQEDFQLEILDENNCFSLKQMYANIRKNKGSNKSYRDSRGDRNDRWDRGDRGDRGGYQDRNRSFGESRGGQRESRPVRSEDLTTELFLSRLPTGISQQELEEEFKSKTGVDSLKLKVIVKTSQDGQPFSFGFIRLENPEDSLSFLQKEFNINGVRIFPRAATAK